MNLEDMFELYEDVKKDMKFFITSEVRMKIVMSLKDGSKNLADLRNEIHLSSSTILHGMNQLEERDIIFRESGNYSLSQIGEMAVSKVIDMMKAFNALKTCKNMFLNHEIDFMSPDLVRDIGCLNKAFVISSTTTDILKPHRILSQLLLDSVNIKHLAPVFYPRNVEMFLKSIERDGKVELVVTQGVLDKLEGVVGTEKLQKLISSGSWRVRVADDDLKFSLTVGDGFIVMGLFSSDGSYDLNMLLVSKDEESVLWGEKLFKHYQESYKKFRI